MRSIIVTGASSGIGRSLARRAAAQGWNVLAVARRGERLTELAHEIRGAGGACATLVADVTAADAPARIITAAFDAFGGIDVVVNNAGAARPGPLLEQRDADIEGQWQLHVAAPLRIARAALALVEARRGGFVLFGSGLARVPAPNYGAYAPAKAAARAAAIQLRRELSGRGIFVTYVDPGVVDTEFSTASGMAAHEAWWHAKPDAVAAAILRGIDRRAARVNAVPWQTAATVLAEWMPSLADRAMASFVVPPAEPNASEPAHLVADTPAEPATIIEVTASAFDEAIEPLRRRMERVKLPEPFVRSLLEPDATIELHDAAMRWAGMPNKNERAAMHEVLDALAAAGFLEATGEERWRVLRAPEPPLS
jgi:short-subunit dehydrogenase